MSKCMIMFSLSCNTFIAWKGNFFLCALSSIYNVYGEVVNLNDKQHVLNHRQSNKKRFALEVFSLYDVTFAIQMCSLAT